MTLKKLIKLTGTFIHTVGWTGKDGRGTAQQIVIQSNDKHAYLRAEDLLKRKMQIVREDLMIGPFLYQHCF